MPAGNDLIFFDNSEDWRVAANISKTAANINENSHTPIPPTDLGVSLFSDYIAVIAGTTSGKPSWQFAGDIRQIYNFAPGGNNPVTGLIQSPPTRLFINKLQIVETTRISPDRFGLKYTPPFWFKDCTVRVYEYTGDALNFVEDTLFDIGNALGIDPNTPGGLISSHLSVIEELITDKFIELNEGRAAEAQLDNLKEQQLRAQINQSSAGIYTLAEGLAALLPPDQGEALRQVTRNRLNLDLGFL